MTLYEVTAWCSLPHYTTFEVEAGSTLEALAKAKTQANDEYPEPCNGPSCEWNEFELSPDDGGATLLHLEPERALEIAAPELLRALQRGAALARDVVARWERGDLAEAVRALSLWLTDAAAVIEQATAGVSL
jgi:hypothetical protein